MSRKRSLMPEIYRNRKRFCATSPQTDESGSSLCTQPENGYIQSDTKSALLFLRNLFPCEKFEGRLPAIVLKHQLFSLVSNKSSVEKELEELQTSGEVHLFQLGWDPDDVGVLLMDDYRSHVCIHTAQLGLNMATINKFLSTVVLRCKDLCLTKEALLGEYKFLEEEVAELVKVSVLNERDTLSWWIMIPGTPTFRKTYLRGRKAVLTMINKCKYKEIYRKDLESRKLPKVARLGMHYHIHDIIGAALVQCVETSAGQLLRLNDT